MSPKRGPWIYSTASSSLGLVDGRADSSTFSEFVADLGNADESDVWPSRPPFASTAMLTKQPECQVGIYFAGEQVGKPGRSWERKSASSLTL